MKLLIFDSGPLINLSMNGLLGILEKLKTHFKGKMVITPPVRAEVCERPSRIPQFELGALSINALIEKKVIELPESIGINAKQLEVQTRNAMDCANHSFRADNHWITLVSDAEMSCIALAQLAKKEGHEPLLVIDERTARLLCEAPENIERLMASKLHRPVIMEKRCSTEFRNLSCIRSSELVYAAYKKGLISLTDQKTLEALIYATKYKGAAISWEEINILKKLG